LQQKDRVVFTAQEYYLLEGKFRERPVDFLPANFLLNLVKVQKQGSQHIREAENLCTSK
jgi:hypothetical protein